MTSDEELRKLNREERQEQERGWRIHRMWLDSKALNFYSAREATEATTAKHAYIEAKRRLQGEAASLEAVSALALRGLRLGDLSERVHDLAAFRQRDRRALERSLLGHVAVLGLRFSAHS